MCLLRRRTYIYAWYIWRWAYGYCSRVQEMAVWEKYHISLYSFRWMQIASALTFFEILFIQNTLKWLLMFVFMQQKQASNVCSSCNSSKPYWIYRKLPINHPTYIYIYIYRTLGFEWYFLTLNKYQGYFLAGNFV